MSEIYLTLITILLFALVVMVICFSIILKYMVKEMSRLISSMYDKEENKENKDEI